MQKMREREVCVYGDIVQIPLVLAMHNYCMRCASAYSHALSTRQCTLSPSHQKYLGFVRSKNTYGIDAEIEELFSQ